MGMKERAHIVYGRAGRRLQTQKEQREASPKLHPRSLARSVGKAMGAGKAWRESVAKLPPKGQKYLHPEKHRGEPKRVEAK